MTDSPTQSSESFMCGCGTPHSGRISPSPDHSCWKAGWAVIQRAIKANRCFHLQSFFMPAVASVCRKAGRKATAEGFRVLGMCAVGITKVGQCLNTSRQLHLKEDTKIFIPSGQTETAAFIKCYCLCSLKIIFIFHQSLISILSWKGGKLKLAKFCLEAAVLMFLTTLIHSFLTSLSADIWVVWQKQPLASSLLHLVQGFLPSSRPEVGGSLLRTRSCWTLMGWMNTSRAISDHSTGSTKHALALQSILHVTSCWIRHCIFVL